jgi:small redox-active disulfide protein 2
MKSIKVLGPGCKKCKQLELNVREAAQKLTGEFKIEKIEDYVEMTKYGMMGTPGLVIDEKLISTGKVHSVAELMEIFK